MLDVVLKRQTDFIFAFDEQRRTINMKCMCCQAAVIIF